MNFHFISQQKVKEMLQKMNPIGNTNLSNLNCPTIDGLIGNFPASVYINDAETMNYLAMNDEGLKICSLKSQNEFEGKNVFYAEEQKQKRNPTSIIQFADKIMRETEHTLSQGNLTLYGSGLFTDENGYCTIRPAIRIPLYDSDGKKIKAVLSSFFETTKTEYVGSLYGRYKTIYSDDMKRGNKLFLQYLGLTGDFNLTVREIETLIAIAKNHTHKDASRELDIAGGTLAIYLQSIKHKLRNQNMNDVLQHFMVNDRRIF